MHGGRHLEAGDDRVMVTAFQPDAFQFDAFQIEGAPTPPTPIVQRGAGPRFPPDRDLHAAARADDEEVFAAILAAWPILNQPRQ